MSLYFEALLAFVLSSGELQLYFIQYQFISSHGTYRNFGSVKITPYLRDLAASLTDKISDFIYFKLLAGFFNAIQMDRKIEKDLFEYQFIQFPR